MGKKPKLKMMITGSNGLLGSKTVEFARNKHIVIPTYRNKPLATESLRLDLIDSIGVTEIIRKYEPSVVIHTASETGVDKCETEREHAWRVNVEGTRNLAVACQKINAKFIFISTDYVFDGEKGCYTESDRPNPINYYGLTKLEAEKRVIENCSYHLILRTSVLYGLHPWKQNFATWVINKLRNNQEITVVEDHFNTPTFAENLAEIVVEAAEKDMQGVYHASGSERINRFEFANRIAEAFNLDRDLVNPIKMKELTAWVAKRPRDSSLNIQKIRKQQIAMPLNISEGLAKLKKEVQI